jgi:hypothetical protein
MYCSRAIARERQPAVGCSAHQPDHTVGGLLLRDERRLVAPVPVRGWRFERAEIPYERKTLMLGSPMLFVLTGIASALRNRSARRTAEAQAAPQWRPLGPLTVVATTHRLLVWHQSAWWSVWYPAVDQMTCDGQQLRLEFQDGSAPYLMAGELEAIAAAMSGGRPPVNA